MKKNNKGGAYIFRSLKFLVFSSTILLFSCKENIKHDLYFEATSPSGKVTRTGVFLETLQGEQLTLSQDIITAKAIRVKDGFLYVSTSKKNQYIHKFTLNGEYQESFISKGGGPGEAIDFRNFRAGNDEDGPYFYGSDLMQNKVIYQNRKDTFDIQFSSLLFDLVRLNDQKLIGVPLEEEKMFGIYNYKGDLLRTFGDFPKNNITDRHYILSQAYAGDYDYNDKNNVFVAALRYTDQLMIFSDMDNEEKYTEIRGPLFYDPIFTVSEKYQEFSQGQEGRFSFIEVTLSNDHIICLFSGFSREEKPGKAGFGDKIFIFDYSGKIIKGFEIKEKLTSISYDEVNNVLYGLDISADEEEIIKYRLD